MAAKRRALAWVAREGKSGFREVAGWREAQRRVASGGMTIDPVLLLQAYAIGVFPMSDDREAQDIYWVEPKKRAVMPLEGFVVSRSLARTIRRDRFTVRANGDFARVVQMCAEAAPDRPSTWINRSIEAAYLELHRLGFAHCVECWDGEDLVGGLYGVSLGRAFFGESMFSRRTDASKVALAWLVARLKAGGFTLLDCQFMTDHLRSLGAVEMRQSAYLKLLAQAVADAPLGRGRLLVDAGAGDVTRATFDPISGADVRMTGEDVLGLLRGAS
ncbi:leucyl/phenylalanyl-tRNA--protein transferase [Sphingobium sp. CECT 9361]|uniref:leucyl/phenylalanyl-tRNA--protein transferase n=1 Tax=Sphingobium sp. CECT 9361 TaxID=2845384 RepID=UPI001E35E1DF|nr:leucyl/phenylalanyl-tRNA--protein transferase [Sphingobium sp. CECT 9361]CAH0354635.1 Leucyl/phenylalanyl-tRNA--protein transferase [Sphingobium sp. CECT 9361]